MADDMETRPYLEEEKIGAAAEAASSSDNEAAPAMPTTGFLATLRGYEAALDRKLGVESHGIARRRPEDRDPAYASWSNQAAMFLLWMSATMVGSRPTIDSTHTHGRNPF